MKKSKDWKLFKDVWISTEPVHDGVWERKEGGHVVRARAKESTTGKLKEIFKVLPKASAAEACLWLEKEQDRVRAGGVSERVLRCALPNSPKAWSSTRRRSARSRAPRDVKRWRYTLEHLIAGTEGEKAAKHVAGFGDFFIDRMAPEHVEDWKAGIAELIAAGDYSPTTANGWLSILRVIMKPAKRRFQLPTAATDDVKDFDTSEVATYTEEEPNALAPEEVPTFLATLRDLYPQHYAMTFLGLITGLRPSSLRPLRRKRTGGRRALGQSSHARSSLADPR